MKKFILLFLYFLSFQTFLGQELHLKIKSDKESEAKTIDSIGYIKKHKNAKLITDEAKLLEQKLLRFGFLNQSPPEIKKVNDTLFETKFNLGKQHKFIHIYIGDNFELLGSTKPIEIKPIQEVENFMNSTLAILEKKGYSLSKIQLINFREENNELHADLNTNVEIKRTLDDIIINGYEKFPEGHIKNIKRIYKNKTLNQITLKSLSSDFDKIRFVKQIKAPEILFTKDSTKVYVYLEKTKPNTFDGYIGFTNIEKKITLNGYLDLKLQNILNGGEKFNIYWKSDGKNQKTFDASLEIPYVLKSSLGIKAQLNIFKQDSIFQNAKTAIDLGYYFNYNSKVYLGYQSTESSDIQNTNNSSLSDFSNSFITTHFDYTNIDNENFLFPEKTIIYFKVGLGRRDSNLAPEKQFFGNLNLSHNFYLNKKNSINIRSHNFYLRSNNYIINELYRFGGINSIRGFNENSLQGNIFTSLLSEYRYSFNDGLYLHSIIDYGYYQDKTSNTTNNLIGLGFGFGLSTKNGQLNLAYANGSTKEQAIKLSNSIVHISFNTRF
ncbi:MAG: hypothetical protein V4670_11400 [Bacteroidota bacterium]